jgi:hypothetical protein
MTISTGASGRISSKTTKSELYRPIFSRHFWKKTVLPTFFPANMIHPAGLHLSDLLCQPSDAVITQDYLV